MGTSPESAGSETLPKRIKRALRRSLARLFGERAVAAWARRLPYAHVTYRLVAWSTAVPAQTEARLGEFGFVLREGTAADLDRLESVTTYDECSVYRGWLAAGQRMVVADEDGMPVSYSWLDFDRMITLDELTEWRVEVGPDACYSHEAFTLHTHRGRSLRRAVFTAELLRARALGKRWVLGYQLKGQAIEDVLRNFERIGIPRGTVVGDVDVVQFAGLRFTARRRQPAPHPAGRFVRPPRSR